MCKQTEMRTLHHCFISQRKYRRHLVNHMAGHVTINPQQFRDLYNTVILLRDITMDEAYGSSLSDLGDSSRKDSLRMALSGIVPGPPLAMNISFALDRFKAATFNNVARSVLRRVYVFDGDDEGDVDDAFRHYADPPFSYKLLAAAAREAPVPEHVVMLFLALHIDDGTPHLHAVGWGRDDVTILGDATLQPPVGVVTAINAALEDVEFSDDDVSGQNATRNFLFRKRADYLACVLHNALLFLRGGAPTALPGIQRTTTSGWLPRLVALVAQEAHARGANGAAVVGDAVRRVQADYVAAFVAITLARVVPVALELEWEECPCCMFCWPSDVFVTCGQMTRCKMCFEEAGLKFVKDVEDAKGTEALKCANTVGEYELALQDHGHLLSPSLRRSLTSLMLKNQSVEEHDRNFHCPLNRYHQKPFSAPMPPTDGSSLAVECTTCLHVWCAQCSYTHHPRTAACQDVIDGKARWDVVSDAMVRAATTILTEFANEKDAYADYMRNDVEGALRLHKDNLRGNIANSTPQRGRATGRLLSRGNRHIA